jgi:hypothetical protein
VLWCAPTVSLQQSKLSVLKKVWGQFLVLIPCDGKIDTGAIDGAIKAAKDKGYGPIAMVCDDLLGHARNPWLQAKFTFGRHQNVSTFTLCQAIFSGAKTSRLNCSAYVVFRFPLLREMAKFADEITTSREKSRQLTMAFSKIVARDPHGCLIVVLDSPSTAEFPSRVRDSRMDTFIPELQSL